MAKTVVNDEVLKSAGTSLAQKGDKIEELLNRYINLLNQVQSSGFAEGAASDSIDLFRMLAVLLQNKTSQQTVQIREYVSCFLSEVNNIDSIQF